MEFVDFRDAYKKLSIQYTLPPFEDLDAQFEFHLVDLERVTDRAVLKVVRRRITDKLSWIINLIQGIVYPSNGSLVSLHESKFFSDKEKDDLAGLLRELMFFERRSLILDLQLREADDAAFIHEFMQSWPSLLEKLTAFSVTLRDGWKATEKKEFHPYFG